MSILEGILYIIFSFIELIFSFIPSFSLPDSAITAFNTMFDLVATIGFFVPLQTLAQILILAVALYFAEFFLVFLQYFLGKIPFLNIK